MLGDAAGEQRVGVEGAVRTHDDKVATVLLGRLDDLAPRCGADPGGSGASDAAMRGDVGDGSDVRIRGPGGPAQFGARVDGCERVGGQ